MLNQCTQCFCMCVCSSWLCMTEVHPQHQLCTAQSSGVLWVPFLCYVLKCCPFQVSRRCHHNKSVWKLVFNLTHGYFLAPPFSSSNILWRKVLSGWTTLRACCNFPISNCKSLIQHALFGNHSTISCFNFLNLCGSSVVSSSMPKNVRHAAGPSSFCSATSTPSLSKHCSRICSSSMHCEDCGGAIIKK